MAEAGEEDLEQTVFWDPFSVPSERKEDGALAECARYTGTYAWKDTKGRLTLLRGDVRFENVVFAYVPEKTVLSGISLYAKPGQKIAFVGSTGAGFA